jgi:hypothetical protein
MAITNYERVGKALELLKAGLAPFVERELRSTYGPRASAEAARFLGEDRINAKKPLVQWDAAPFAPCHVGGLERGFPQDARAG